ncbi:hypothetical protein P8452_17472 [Trifolium repens]|nr:hypothetical protein P8452_17472 [Trifolium repens]
MSLSQISKRDWLQFLTKCLIGLNIGHNRSTCKSKTQDPDALKRKRKPPKGKATSTKVNQGKAAADQSKAAADQSKATSSATAEGQSSHSPIEPLVNVTQSQVEEVIDASQSLFDEIPDEMIATIPEVNPDDIPKKAKAVRNKDVKAKAKSEKKRSKSGKKKKSGKKDKKPKEDKAALVTSEEQPKAVESNQQLPGDDHLSTPDAHVLAQDSREGMSNEKKVVLEDDQVSQEVINQDKEVVSEEVRRRKEGRGRDEGRQ